MGGACVRRRTWVYRRGACRSGWIWVRQPDHNRIVAVKVFDLEGAESADIAAFERECSAIGQLDWCPNIVTFFQAGRTPHGEPYIVMEYAPGKSLAHRIKEHGRLDESATRRIGERIASALSVAHAAKILHRDVKPANILISRTDDPLLADFGIAKLSLVRRVPRLRSDEVARICREMVSP